MKKTILIATSLIFTLFFLSSCDEESVVTPDTGKVFISSVPDSAQIFLDGNNTGKVTPDTVEASAGVHDITLTRTNYQDTTFSVSFSAGETGIVSIILTPKVGELIIESTPAGAEIWLNGVNTNFVTPHTFSNLDAGSYNVTLSLTNYVDTTFVATVTPGHSEKVSITLNPELVAYGPVRLYETVGTTADQPSGLDLSAGTAYGISSADKDKVDIYYSSDGFIVRSASDHSQMTRVTWFKVGNGTDLNDGVDSPVKDNSWTNSMSDRESNYVFLYDNDHNYSKIKIVNFGGGTPGDPAWVEVQWIYNKATDNTQF